MRLQELFLMESTDEDRAIISLASALWQKALKYKKPDREPEHQYHDDDFDDDDVPDDFEEPEEDVIIKLGTIGKLLNTPLEILNPVKVQLQSDYGLRKRVKNEDGLEVMKEKGSYYGLWDPDKNTMTLNRDLIDEPAVRSAIAHELRHALDDYKSDFKAGTSTRYWTPKDKSYRGVTDDPYLGNVDYIAKPGEINARFVETLNSMVPVIKKAVKDLEPEYLRSYILAQFKDALRHHSISHLFPEKEKSKDYKRLVNRGIEFMRKEVEHQLQIQGKNQHYSPHFE